MNKKNESENRANLRHRLNQAIDEEDVTKLLKQYFQLNATTQGEVETTLQRNKVPFQIWNEDTLNNFSYMNQDKGFEIIALSIDAPSVWQSFLPFGSMYHVQLHFMDKVLSDIKISRSVNEF